MAGLIAAELAGLALAYQVLSDLECRRTEAQLGCDLLRSLVARAVVVTMAFGLFIWARPGTWLAAQEERSPPARERPTLPSPGRNGGASYMWLAVHGLGVALLAMPLALSPATVAESDLFFDRALPFWIAGAALAIVGALFYAAKPLAWRRWLAAESYSPLIILALVALGPDLGRALLPVWEWQGLARVTFAAVSLLLTSTGAEVYVDPAAYVIGLRDFFVEIGPPCAGTEGFVLITAFVALYGYLFRGDLRFPQYWLIVLPLGLILSWVFNVVRIATLLLIGARASPEIAVNGFHSHAGWMFFALLALGLIAVVHATPALHTPKQAPVPLPLMEDWYAARILPFAVFLLTGTVGSALTVHPDLAFPARALAVAAALALFWRHYRRIEWTPDPVAVIAGLSVGIAWIALQPPLSSSGSLLMDAVASLSGPMLAVWVAARLLGTSILVPVVEELFFRGYLLERLDGPGVSRRILAVAASSAAFAMMHGRWLEAGMAGVVFAGVMLRRQRVGDAIVAHVAANSLIGLWAIISSDWSVL
ncbi:exosortase E/protease, VPEID-CTERM system [Rubellimicrobium rubrum]|nr:exosortase E/protease, VPEID-CTERM system [Rubellimicrobium rubrum]